MPDSLPEYYTRLAPFQSAFETGLPILMYHKLGPRPPHVRIKGLYVPARLFTKQLAELSAAGYTSSSLPMTVADSASSPRRVVLTFDDGFRNVMRHGMEPLRRFGFRAIQFLVADLIGKTNEWEQREGEAREALMDDSEIREWLAAGHEIGAHTLTHPDLTRVSPAKAREEISASKKKIEDRFGVTVEHFCYPYGGFNASIQEMVRASGYRSACTVAPGVNTPDVSHYELKRFFARHPSRGIKALLQALRRRPVRIRG